MYLQVKWFLNPIGREGNEQKCTAKQFLHTIMYEDTLGCMVKSWVDWKSCSDSESMDVLELIG